MVWNILWHQSLWCYSAGLGVGAIWCVCVGGVLSELCVGLLLASHAYKWQQVPFYEASVLTKNHYHSDSMGFLSWGSSRICFKELSSWQPEEMGGLCFPILSWKIRTSGNLGRPSHKGSNCWEMNHCCKQGALQPCGSPWFHPAEYCPCPLGRAAGDVGLGDASSFRSYQPRRGATISRRSPPTRVPCLPFSKQSILSR